MKFNFFSQYIPTAIRSSIALKVFLYVGTTIAFLFLLQTYISVTQIEKKLIPLIDSELSQALTSSESIFDITVKQTREDIQLIGSHNALQNYLDYEIIDDIYGANQELVKLELFLTSLTDFKYQYENIEIVTALAPIIHVVKGEVVQASSLYQDLFVAEKSSHVKHTIDAHDHGDQSKFSSEFYEESGQVFFTLTHSFTGDNVFIDGTGSEVFITITNNITKEVRTLADSLAEDNILLSLYANKKLILDVPQVRNSDALWLEDSLLNDHLKLLLTVYKNEAFAFSLIKEMRWLSFILAILSIVVISISLFLTAKYIVAAPLKHINRFINNDVLKQTKLETRYKTDHIDEIAVFSHALNNMLDQIQLRQDAFKDSEERLALALWGGGEGMWELSFNNNMVFLDTGSTEILGLGKSSISQTIDDFLRKVHADDVERLRRYIETFYLGMNQLFEIEFRLYVSNDSIMTLQLKGKLNQQRGDNSPQGLTGTLRDITEQIKAEQDVHLYATAFNVSNNGIVILDTNFKSLAINKAFTRITGFTIEEVYGTLPSFIQYGGNSFSYDDVHEQISIQGYWNGEQQGLRKDNKCYDKDIDLNPVYDKDHELTHYVCVFSDITQKKKSESELWKLANNDILTQLPNRGFFRGKLKSAIEQSSTGEDFTALLFIDLDKFKQVNDTLGHEAGDELLKKVAETLKNCTRKNDTVSRLGGDEFAILLENINQKKHAEIIANKIIAEFTNGLTVGGNPTGVGVSIGISFFPVDADNTQSLVHCADTAMYSAKTSGSNTYKVYNTAMGEHVNRRNQIEQELIYALKENSLSLYYQPLVDLKTGGIVSFEALSRWIHPKLGFISPEEFIPIAEETGLIAQLGQNVFKQACKQLKLWQNQGYDDLRMAINISPRQFLLTDIYTDLSNTIEETEVDTHYLELELTESLIIDDPEKITVMLHKLKSIGLRLSIDDFGTGYSSLSYLSKFPLDTLKIDKSFIHQMENDPRGLALTKAIIGIAKSLDLDIIAEGVETQSQLDTLTTLGCQYMQGYFYSRPVSAEDATKLLEKSDNLYGPQSDS